MKSCPRCHSTYPSHFSLCPRDGTALIEAGEWSEGMLIRGKYRILNKVGQGGMGAVYKAHHVMFEELRALKVMNADLLRDEVFVRRFKQEAVIARKLDHPNAVRVDDIDEAEDGRPFIVMEYIEGVSLKKVIQEEGRLTPARAWSIAAQVAGALDAAHRIGMVHRDIKPANVVLVHTPEGEQAKVLDFGIAKLKEARADEGAGLTLTGTGMVVGTPQYMSPEQASGKRGDQLDGRSDLYSLGVVMYQMLTGELPFKSDTTMGLLMAHISSPPRPMLEARPGLDVPAGLVQLVMRCLEKKPEMRPPTGAALIQEFQPIEQVAWPGGPTQTLPAASRAPSEEIQWTFAGARAPRAERAPAASSGTAVPVSSTPLETGRDVGTIPEVIPVAHSPGMGRWIAAVIAAIIIIGAGFAVWRFDIYAPARATHSASRPGTGPAQGATSKSGEPARSLTASAPAAGLKQNPNASGASAGAPGGGEDMAQKSGGNTEAPFRAGRSSDNLPIVHKAPESRSSSHHSVSGGSMRHVSRTSSPAESDSTESLLPDVVVLTAPAAPGATVFMDGKREGTADAQGRLSIAGAKPGLHRLRLTLPGVSGIPYSFNVPPSDGATSTVVVTVKWKGLQTPQTALKTAAANGTGSAPSGANASQPAVKPFVRSFGVIHVHRFGFGSCKGVLVIRDGSIQFRADNGKDSFLTPLNGVIWGKTSHGDFYVRLADGREYTFRSESPSAIVDAIQKALGQK
jgi:tRNA A-37 threonylcarbamoyl transferase component Bud32